MSEKRIRTPSLKSAMDKRLKDEKNSTARIAQRRAVAAEPPPGLAAVAAEPPPGLAAVFACLVCAGSCHAQYFCSEKIVVDHGLPFLLEVDVQDGHLGALT